MQTPYYSSALEVIFNEMRYINLRFTYLLTYSLYAAFLSSVASVCSKLSSGKAFVGKKSNWRVNYQFKFSFILSPMCCTSVQMSCNSALQCIE